MPRLAYRLYFGSRSATQDELDHVEEVVVEQTMDMAWEARIRLFMCLDDSGHWHHGAQEFGEPFSRVRLELRVGSDFVPLIDGTVAATSTALDSQPGRSTVTLVVRDDSVLLNREEGVEPFEDKTDHAVAREVFQSFAQIASTRIESTSGPERVAVRRGTAMQFLRELAAAHEFHAYVLPGAAAGQSIGCFLPDPGEPGTLPQLILLGSERNVADLEVHEESEGPQRTQARTMRITDGQVVSSEKSPSDLVLMRPLPPVPSDHTALRLLPPEDNDREDPEASTTGRTRRASYAFRVRGRLVPGCYGGVLAPYQRVTVKTGDLPLSGDWLLTKVIHRITPHLYTQEFEAKADSKHEAEAAQSDVGGGIGLSVSFSASISVF
jgi:hypothetical protein